MSTIKYLDKTVFHPYLLIINSKGPLKKDIPEGILTYDLGIKRIRYALPRILSLLRSIKPDIIISTLVHLNLLILGAKYMHLFDLPIIVREANTPSIRLGSSRNPFLFNFFYKILYHRARMIICNSQHVKMDIMDSFGIKENKIKIAYNPVDTIRIKELISKEANPYLKGKYHLVAVGRLNHQKGFDLLMQVFQRALREIPKLHLTIIGEGPEKRSLKDLAMGLGISESTSFTGHQLNPFPYMAHADIFLSTSRYEGSPNVVLESLACGTPVLAFDCPGGTGEIIKDGKNGWLVPNGNVKAMQKRLVEIVKGEEWSCVEKSKMLPESHDISKAVKVFENIIIEALR